MPRRPKRPTAGPGAARFRAAAAQSNLRGGFSYLAASRQDTLTNGFSMRDEARNTGQRSSLWDRDTNLRAKPVAFVSAGLIEPLKEEPRVDQDDETPEEISDTIPGFEGLNKQISEALPTNGGIGFMVDVTGDKSLSANLTHTTPTVPEPQSAAEESDTSTEVILFKGRANISRAKKHIKAQPTQQAVALDTINYETKAVAESMTAEVVNTATTSAQIHRHPRHQSRHQPQRKDGGTASEDEEAAIIADYIANMAGDSGSEEGEGSNQQSFTRCDLGADDMVFGSLSGDSPSPGHSVVSDDEDNVDDDVDVDGDLAIKQAWEENEATDSAMDDETLARLLSKQEELGMGSDELLLVSDMVDPTSYAGSSWKARARGKHLNPKVRGHVPSASAVADAFDDLDLMDWERPSLQNQRNRGRRVQPPVFGASDSELESSFHAAWQKDRESKKSRKIHREELRAQGLLGKHADPDDPRLKYPNGLTSDDLRTAMRTFLLGSEPKLQFPPMDKSARKVVHEFANKFKVKSQSTGSGDQRRTMLYRTKYTIAFTEEHFEAAFSRVHRKHFPRLDMKGKGKATSTKGRAGAGNAAVTYRDGEIVGASAPELGQENKGRTMLEKMGWSTGMGLGSLDNKGILQPVAHVVKRTKAGLG